MKHGKYTQIRIQEMRTATRPKLDCICLIRQDEIALEEAAMIGVLIRFQYAQDFDEARIRKIASEARGKFLGMPGLRSKSFTVDAEKREAVNFYVWDSEAAAREFFAPEAIRRVAGLYGVQPTIQFLDLAALVENVPSG
jgi:heme-degrading monooxygenase HmoA